MITPDPLKTSDERLMAALAHLFGPVIAFFIWATQREKSEFVKFQSLQALAFDITLTITSGVLFFCLFGLVSAGMVGWMYPSMGNTPTQDTFMPIFMYPAIFPLIMVSCIFPFSLLITGVRFIAFISILNGRNYKYPIIGRYVENFLNE